MIYKSPFDNAKFSNVNDLTTYVETYHMDKVPTSYKSDVYRFLYDLRNDRRRCQICGVKTQWNSKLRKYEVLCSIPDDGSLIEKSKAYLLSLYSFFRNKGNTCFSVMRKQYLSNISKVYGKDVVLMQDPEYQKKLLESRKLASVTKYNGREYTVIGTYEKLFIDTMEAGKYKPLIQMPGNFIELPNGGYTIPDVYIPSKKLYVSIKDTGDIPKYIDNYLKSIEVYEYVNTNGLGYHMIELNGVDEISKASSIIESITAPKDVLKYPPVYIHRYKPEAMDRIINNFK